ncbi:FAD-binding oxidoreductase [Ferrovibrio terrae]|nr:FAD-binding oxidoreductase [Ferrovibrio terrae]
MSPGTAEEFSARLPHTDGKGLAHGMGRSYGDACLNKGGTLWLTARLDRFIAFDPTTGILACEAGMLLRDIQRLTEPYGWMLPVMPGTLMVTVGGAIANDVHGKNHVGFGSFGDHVRRITLVRTDGEIIECSPAYRAGWLAATVGGLGLTGVIVAADLQLRRMPGPWLDTDIQPFAGSDEFFQIADESRHDWEHMVAWLDCTSVAGRGIFQRAKPTCIRSRPAPRVRQWTVPFTPPVSFVNRISLGLLNAAYFHVNRSRSGRTVRHYAAYLFPLDNLQHWNRLYGPRGFYQYQCVLPPADAPHAVKAMLADIAHSGDGSVLAVLKVFGDRSAKGMLSFPRPGVTLALDFPNRADRTLRIFERLDDILRDAGGCIYPAKDARMPRDLFESGYPRLDEFSAYRDPGISSSLSRRLMGS